MGTVANAGRWLLRTVREAVSPPNLVSSLLFAAAGIAVPAIWGAIMRWSLPSLVALGVVVFLVLIAIGVYWRERHIRRPFSGKPVYGTPGLSFPRAATAESRPPALPPPESPPALGPVGGSTAFQIGGRSKWKNVRFTRGSFRGFDRIFHFGDDVEVDGLRLEDVDIDRGQRRDAGPADNAPPVPPAAEPPSEGKGPNRAERRRKQSKKQRGKGQK